MNKESNKKRTIRQVQISDSNKEYRRLVKFLKEKGYKINNRFEDIKDEERIVALIIDNTDRTIFTTNVTCMAAWCSGKRRPLKVEEFISNYDELIIKGNINKYNEMITKRG